MAPDPGDDAFDPFKAADAVVKKPKETWWKGLDDDQRTAWWALIGAGAVGVLGTPILSILLKGSGAPPVKEFVAAFWLLVITLPVAAVVALGVYLLKSPPRLSNAVVLLALMAFAALVGVGAMNAMLESLQGGLEGFYC